ncbi:hypothetical protein ACFQ1I_19070 [Kitasatospora arboriphila]
MQLGHRDRGDRTAAPRSSTRISPPDTVPAVRRQRVVSAPADEGTATVTAGR